MADGPFQIVVLSGLFAVCRLEPGADIPGWAMTGAQFSITRTADELSVVCLQDHVPAAIRAERDWRCLRIAGTIAFAMIGVVASFSRALAQSGVGIFVISTFDTDYVLLRPRIVTRRWRL